METRVCGKCGIEKTWYFFRGRSLHCRKCKEKDEESSKADLDKARDNMLRASYGITLEIYNEMLRSQEGVCAICRGRQQKDKALCVDHCHKTGKVRGLLCNACNSMLGFAKDKRARLRAAAAYLEEHATNPL